MLEMLNILEYRCGEVCIPEYMEFIQEFQDIEYIQRIQNSFQISGDLGTLVIIRTQRVQMSIRSIQNTLRMPHRHEHSVTGLVCNRNPRRRKAMIPTQQ